MNSRHIRLGVLVVAGAVIGGDYWSQREQLGASRRELASLREQQDRAAIQVQRLPLIVQAQRGASQTTALNPAVSPPGASSAPRDPRDTTADDQSGSVQRWEDEAKANQAAIEAAYAAEQANGAWSTMARIDLHDRLVALSERVSSSVGSIDCRSSICRVEMTYKNSAALRQFGETAFAISGERVWKGPVVITPPQANIDGSLVAVMYLGREGTSLLPSVPQEYIAGTR